MIVQMRKKYPSDITQEQFEHIRPILEGHKRKTRPRVVDLYEIFCAVLYVLRSGCQWRMLPEGLPKWRTVYYYFQQWSEIPEGKKTSLLDRALKKLVSAARQKQERETLTRYCIIDAQSVRNVDTAESKG